MDYPIILVLSTSEAEKLLEAINFRCSYTDEEEEFEFHSLRTMIWYKLMEKHRFTE